MRAMAGAARPSAGVPAGLSVGVLATFTMDLAMVAAAKLDPDRFADDRLGPKTIGRWVASCRLGVLRSDDIAQEPAKTGEAAIGMAAHYATGLALTWIYFLALRMRGRRSSLSKATAYGATTALLPLLVMYPAWGYGAFGLRDPDAARLARAMLLGHTAFGAGIGLWTALLCRDAGVSELPDTR
jgi:hypothetical protein